MNETQLLQLYQQLEREEELDNARESHLEFMQHTWKKPKSDPFIVGFHTRQICAEIDQAIENYRNGISTYLLISVHQRAGKSDIVSRFLPSHFLGEFPDAEVMAVSYQASLAAKFSAYGKGVFLSDKFKELYPDVGLSKEFYAKDYWEVISARIKGVTGKLFACGLTSGLTGSGWHLGILDDYCAGRKEAESEVMRNNAWEAFTNDFMTRAAPVHICVVLATQWHWDDINGRIKNQMKSDPNFPQFKIIAFPAKAANYKDPKKYPGKYLFLERYDETWYKSQYATLGRYAAAALLDCDPQMRTGSILSTDGIVYHDKNDIRIPDVTAIQWAFIWDLAHTAKQRTGDDPDYTSGTLMAFQDIPGDPVPHLWIKVRHRFRLGAKKRDERIRAYTKAGGKFIRYGIENSVESKDAYDYIRTAMPDFNWESIDCPGDKVVRCAPLEPIFEAPAHVHVIRGDYIDEWLDEIIKFSGDGSGHDDGVDNLTAGYIMLKGTGNMQMTDEQRKAMAARRSRG